MRTLDWLIVAAYLIYIVWSGARLARDSKQLDGYFLAGRSLPWWAVGLSIMATQLSAITLVGTTGQAYADGMRFIQFYYGLPLAMIVLSMTVVPFFYRARVFTAYEYLEQRFDVRVRTLTSLCFLISRGLGVGVIIAAPSVILSIVLGWSEVVTVFAMGLTTTAYTMIGGVQAVTWTDVKQMLVIFLGLTVCLFVIISRFPADVSVTDALALAGATNRLTTVDTTFDLTQSYTLWSGLIGGFFLMLAYFGCDQSQVQRFLTAKSVDEGRTSLVMNAFIKIPMQFLVLFIGVMVFVFYQFTAPPLNFNRSAVRMIERSPYAAEYESLSAEYNLAHERRKRAAEDYARDAGREGESAVDGERIGVYLEADKALNEVRARGVALIETASDKDKTFNDVNHVFPSFVIGYMPMGVVGLIIAAIFAAAMSSISAELNALATATTIDFYRRHYKPEAGDVELVRAGRLATLAWGIFACIVALYATSLGSLIEVVNRFGSFFYGSLLGVFVLAFGVKRATSRGAFWGLLCGIAAVWVASLTTNIAFLWFNVVGCFVVVVIGWLISLTDSSGQSV
ncbi:MAG: sodium:solute symporter [Pyrinomonadaceae bacterium MAG19_C2-C3]|nr:sodium:solute symporter [Pyrinomonadaceae bacterium MAG19_C2-C3]